MNKIVLVSLLTFACAQTPAPSPVEPSKEVVLRWNSLTKVLNNTYVVARFNINDGHWFDNRLGVGNCLLLDGFDDHPYNCKNLQNNSSAKLNGAMAKCNEIREWYEKEHVLNHNYVNYTCTLE